MFRGIETVVYYVEDLKAAAAWYQQVLGVEPNHVSDFYVGFTVGGDELGLHPADADARPRADGQTAYWSVASAEAAVAHLMANGARAHRGIQDVGGGIKVATVLDPFGNAFGVLENPHSPNR